MSGLDWSCPAPAGRYTTVQMAHGGGGRAMRDLIHGVFLQAFSTGPAAPQHDSAVLASPGGRIAFTTDTFVVRPLFFPGGDIGRLAVFGTVNDLAMAGARPLWLSAGFVLEEGFPLADLARVAASMRQAADEAGVAIVTGDTKVVDRGKGDGVYVNTAGIGSVPDGVDISPARVAPGDVVVLSGDLGRHGVAVMSVREGLAFESPVESDCAPLAGAVAALLEVGVDVRCLRDLTRGGLASALNEIALDAGVGVEVREEAVPVSGPVAAACEVLGLDPFYVANEGRFVAFVPTDQADRAVRAVPGAVVIGRVTADHPSAVHLAGTLGGTRVLDLLSGEQMPRIC